MSPLSVLLLLTADDVVIRTMNKAAEELGLRVARTTERIATDPAVVVIDVEQPGAIDEAAALRAKYPDAIVVAHLSAPDRDRWLAAERAGCDVVANRGAAARQLLALVRSGRTERRYFALVDASDIAGRLGFVGAFGTTPLGPVALYRVGSTLCAISDRCPHAGSPLASGALDGQVVTCPRHGSQFDVQTGERRRGPADENVGRYDVQDTSGRVELVYSSRDIS
jgi:nitrite reductase/ring-hydroxylating ferredoxin subunit